MSEPPQDERATIHVRGQMMLAGVPLEKYSIGRIYVVEQVIRNLEYELEAQLGPWKEASFTPPSAPGKPTVPVTPSRVSRSTRIMMTFFSMSKQPGELQALMFNHKAFLSAAFEFWDGLKPGAIDEAYRLYETAWAEITGAEVDVVPDKKPAGPKE